MMFGNLVTGCSVLAPRRVGQAVGSAIGGLLYAHELMYGIGYAGAAFVALALVMMISTRGGSARRQAEAHEFLSA